MTKLACAAALNVLIALFVHAPEYTLAALATPASAASAAALVLPADRLRRFARRIGCAR